MEPVDDLPVWDLSELYARSDDPRLDDDLARVESLAADFERRFRGRLGEADAVLAALREQEAILELFGRVRAYAYLEFSTNSADPAFRRLLVRTDEVSARLDERMVFFRLELLALPEGVFDRIAAAPELADYRNFLRQIARYRPHQLGEKEEILIGKKDITGKNAFVRLYDELTTALTFTVTLDGRRQRLPGAAARNLFYHPEAAVRAGVVRAYFGQYARHGQTIATVFNSLVRDHGIECELRRFPHSTAPTHLANQVEEPTVRLMMDRIAAQYGLVQDYYRLKARIMGLARVRGSDLYAPVGEPVRDIPFARARTLVVDAFRGFDAGLGALAERFFEERWIHAPVRRHKGGGAYCYGPGPGTHPFVLLNYSGSLRDVFTMAHELGHGLHDLLAAGQTYLNYHPPTVAAETASVFGEMLLAAAVKREIPLRDRLIGFYCSHLEDIIATVFRQNMYTRFEREAHDRVNAALMSSEELCSLWREETQRLYGDAVDFSPVQRWNWAAIPHFFHYRFYCYAYSFGELFVLCLYQRYLEEGAAFVERYKDILRRGGSATPYELAASVGEDLDSPAFWDKGFCAIRGWLSELRALVDGGS
ncbi:MAG: M3 family oligoendopeptidase [Acidobacteria bacterium]|nr:M3 family oligoendopeptidase [Acidobacteriota bacterium]